MFVTAFERVSGLAQARVSAMVLEKAPVMALLKVPATDSESALLTVPEKVFERALPMETGSELGTVFAKAFERVPGLALARESSKRPDLALARESAMVLEKVPLMEH